MLRSGFTRDSIGCLAEPPAPGDVARPLDAEEPPMLAALALTLVAFLLYRFLVAPFLLGLLD